MISVHIVQKVFSNPKSKANSLCGCPCPQLCSGVDEHAVGTSAELVFAPIDASFSDDAPILPSGFRIIPLDSGTVSLLASI